MNHIEKVITPVWENIEKVRESVSRFLDELGVDHDTVYSASMASSELIENAIKYGSEKKDITVIVELKNNKISIEVKNKAVSASDENLLRLDRAVQWIKSFSFPFEAYIEKLRYVSSIDIDEGESGLGLVRIAFEAHADVDFYIDENRTICVSAILPSGKKLK